MTAHLDHTIVPARDKHASAAFLAEILGVEVGEPMGQFVPVRLDGGVTLDFADGDPEPSRHYAFLVDDTVFDTAYERLTGAGATIWADPHHTRPGVINTRFNGRGFYFLDPNGHNMELLTRSAPVG
jgi:catechol 2,3-dioxygenase-like lactoylglutathione lyase family enzyme